MITRPLLLIMLVVLSSIRCYSSINLKLPLPESTYSSVTQNSILFIWEGVSPQFFIEFSSDSLFGTLTSFNTSSNRLEVSMSNFTTNKYYWRVRSSNDTSSIQTFYTFDLYSIGNIIYHINADSNITSNNGKISEWGNIIDSTYNLSQANTNNQPDYMEGAINSNAIVLFGGANANNLDYFNQADFLIADTNFSFFSAYKNTSINPVLGYLVSRLNPFGGIYTGGLLGSDRSFGITNVSPNTIYNLNQPNTNWIVTSLHYNSIYSNGIKETNVSGSGVDRIQFNTLGSRTDLPTFNFRGYLGDILIYNEILPDSSRLLVENYLKTKYTPYPDLGNDTTVCGESVDLGFRTDHGYSSIQWSTGDMGIDSITVIQNGWYWVEVESFGWVIRDSVFIDGIVPKPSLNQQLDTLLCLGDSLVLNYSSPLGGYNILWSTNDTTPTITAKTEGWYWVSHSDTAGCYAQSDSFYLTVDSFAIQSTLGLDRSECLGANLAFETTSTGNEPYTYLWSTGDTTAFIELDSLGNNEYWVIATDFYGCQAHDTVQINLLNLSAPAINFSYDTSCPFTATDFTDFSIPNATDPINNWQWVFPNDTVTTQNPVYTHLQTGNYNVTLNLETDSGCLNSLTQTIYQHKQPNANFQNVVACAESATQFQSTALVSVPDNINQYYWNFNGTLDTGNQVNHTFNLNQIVPITHQVVTNQGCIDSVTRQVEVFPAINPNFTFANTCIGDSVTFTDQTASLSTVAWSWNFGTGNDFSAIQNPKFLYANTGNYPVTLTVQNAIGCVADTTITVSVVQPPQLNILPDTTCLNQSVQLSATYAGNDSVIAWQWVAANDTILTENPSVTFSNLGANNVVLNIETQAGCKVSYNENIQLTQPPVAGFNYTPRFGEAPLQITFENTSTNAQNYQWEFDDGSPISQAFAPQHTYTQNGIYNVTLIAENQYGCTNQITEQLNINPSELDIELTNLNVMVTNNQFGNNELVLDVDFANIGSQEIVNAKFALRINNETRVFETWEGNLQALQTSNYAFSSTYVLPAFNQAKYVCVEAYEVNQTTTETNTSNNKVCAILEGNVQISEAYPNPAVQTTFIDVVSLAGGNINVEAYNVAGQVVSSISNLNLKKGYNKIAVNTGGWQVGKYYIKLSNNSVNEIREVIIR